MAEDLRLRGEAIMKSTRPEVPQQIPQPSFAKMALNAALGTAQMQTQDFLNQKNEIENMGLGAFETKKRLDALSSKYQLLSLLDPNAANARRAIARKDPEAEMNAAFDNALEKNTLSYYHSLMTKATTYEDYQKLSKTMHENVLGQLKTGPSDQYIGQYDALNVVAQEYIPTMQKMSIRAGSNKEVVDNFLNTVNTTFFNALGGRSPTTEELDMLVGGMEANLGGMPGTSGSIGKSLYDLLKASGNQELVQHASQKYPQYFTPSSVQDLQKQVVERAKYDVIQGPKTLEEIDQKVADNNALGKYTPIDPSLVKDAATRKDLEFLQGKMMNRMSPKDIEFQSRNNWSEQRPLLDKIQEKTAQDFAEDFPKAAKERELLPEVAPLKMPQFVDKQWIGLDDFLSSYRDRVYQASTLKNVLFKGYDALQNVYSADEKRQLSQVFSDLPADQRWHLAREMGKVLDQTIENKPGYLPLSKEVNIGSLMFDAKDNRPDDIISNMLEAAKEDEVLARNSYHYLRDIMSRKPEQLETIRFEAGRALIQSLGFSNAVSTETFDMTRDIMAAEIAKTKPYFGSIKVEEGKLSHAQILFRRGEIFSKKQGKDYGVIVKVEDRKNFNSALENTRVDIKTDAGLVNYSLKDALKLKNVRIVNEKYSYRRFRIQVAKDARALAEGNVEDVGGFIVPPKS